MQEKTLIKDIIHKKEGAVNYYRRSLRCNIGRKTQTVWALGWFHNAPYNLEIVYYVNPFIESYPTIPEDGEDGIYKLFRKYKLALEVGCFGPDHHESLLRHYKNIYKNISHSRINCKSFGAGHAALTLFIDMGLV